MHTPCGAPLCHSSQRWSIPATTCVEPSGRVPWYLSHEHMSRSGRRFFPSQLASIPLHRPPFLQLRINLFHTLHIHQRRNTGLQNEPHKVGFLDCKFAERLQHIIRTHQATLPRQTDYPEDQCVIGVRAAQWQMAAMPICCEFPAAFHWECTSLCRVLHVSMTFL